MPGSPGVPKRPLASPWKLTSKLPVKVDVSTVFVTTMSLSPMRASSAGAPPVTSNWKSKVSVAPVSAKPAAMISPVKIVPEASMLPSPSRSRSPTTTKSSPGAVVTLRVPSGLIGLSASTRTLITMSLGVPTTPFNASVSKPVGSASIVRRRVVASKVVTPSLL